ncbi:zinc finger protein 69 homolog isoform X2 [Belonocnema kinseyi]|uniref:zinc finger protein 69 homolog isoform X2 n=1 Tax=Belonocnema kinseyi TaxID=2817044 RepID=UPI00143CE356|nr:zinc finger protein 69 homolog isoform X2 [Belonocnema kinseyi]
MSKFVKRSLDLLTKQVTLKQNRQDRSFVSKDIVDEMRSPKVEPKLEVEEEESPPIDMIDDVPFEVQNIWLDLAQEIARQKAEAMDCNNTLFQGSQSEDYFYCPVSDYMTAEEVVIPMDIEDEIHTPNLDAAEVEIPHDIDEHTNLILDTAYEDIPEDIHEQKPLILDNSYAEVPQDLSESEELTFEEETEDTHLMSDGEIEIPDIKPILKLEHPTVTEERKKSVRIRSKRKDDIKTEDLNFINIKQEYSTDIVENKRSVKARGRRRGIKFAEKPVSHQISFEEKENPPTTEKKTKTVKPRNKRKGIKLSEKIGNRQIAFEGNVTYTCEKCKTKFESKSLLTHHIKTTHSRNNKFSCKFCAMQTTTGYNYRRHLIRFHSREEDPEVQDLIKSFFSSKRNKVFPTARTYAGFPCDKCTKQFSSENTRKLHMERLHSEERRNVNADSVRRKSKKIRSRS